MNISAHTSAIDAYKHQIALAKLRAEIRNTASTSNTSLLKKAELYNLYWCKSEFIKDAIATLDIKKLETGFQRLETAGKTKADILETIRTLNNVIEFDLNKCKLNAYESLIVNMSYGLKQQTGYQLGQLPGTALRSSTLQHVGGLLGAAAESYLFGWKSLLSRIVIDGSLSQATPKAIKFLLKVSAHNAVYACSSFWKNKASLTFVSSQFTKLTLLDLTNHTLREATEYAFNLMSRFCFKSHSILGKTLRFASNIGAGLLFNRYVEPSLSLIVQQGFSNWFSFKEPNKAALSEHVLSKTAPLTYKATQHTKPLIITTHGLRPESKTTSSTSLKESMKESTARWFRKNNN